MSINDLKKYCGYYRPLKGALTNTRVYMMGIQFKISIRNEKLVLSSLSGSYKKGIELISTNDPLEYRYIYKTQGASVKPYETILFFENKQGNITHLAIDKYRLNKHTFFGSLFGMLLKILIPISLIVSILTIIF